MCFYKAAPSLKEQGRLSSGLDSHSSREPCGGRIREREPEEERERATEEEREREKEELGRGADYSLQIHTQIRCYITDE